MSDKQRLVVESIKSEVKWPTVSGVGQKVKIAVEAIESPWFWIDIVPRVYAKSGMEILKAVAQGTLPVSEYGDKMKVERDGTITIR